MQNQIDSLLIQACKKGNQVAQMQVYDNYCKAMFTIAYRYLNDEESAKDAMQEGFLKAFTNIESYKPNATFGAWLKRIVINQCLDVLKKQKLKFSDAEVEDLELIEDNNWNFETSITKTDILKAIDQLQAKHKIVVQLYLIEGYDHIEISEILNIPIKTSRTHLSRGKATLRDLLKPKYNEARY
ncbi:RNA polymerase sigma factor [Winogradskyella luteola]|uniref:Sigma-70 family RNA polymerase sigma factor n=1 Tax=Winogradskyella luteola TaxID=2828330 RepID=A0A9X1JTE2_9FLAO|nr:sigma-70 family RNA polymerase sigma factor [Winogradskyella luteola]MBV7270547.1 sigma-70 family RNA polymerase sigma factor [Winogradskyella luteola]